MRDRPPVLSLTLDSLQYGVLVRTGTVSITVPVPSHIAIITTRTPYVPVHVVDLLLLQYIPKLFTDTYTYTYVYTAVRVR